MTDLRVRFGIILALALFPILLFSIYMAFINGRILLVAISIMAWVFGYFSLWISTEKLVFSHLRKIKVTSDQFATGDMSARVGSMPGAPTRIVELATAFDYMADNISDRETRLLDNLDEKEVLLREIHHRVKNNLQIIISLLNMQERKLDDHEALAAIKETRGRINAIALVHRGLYEGKDLRIINMPVFLTRLVDELKIGLGTSEMNIGVNVNAENINLEPDAAIPVALFVVEALTNALKHGVSNGGQVVISLAQEDHQIIIAVHDDGQGHSEAAPGGTGLKLMKGFARQLSGKYRQEDTLDGHRVSLAF